jgi:FlaA1/EpsC-like NDP-sugar epimerase
MSGNAKIDDIREVPLVDLMGRAPAPPNLDLLHVCITDKTVLVSGAGGSIGKELRH